jgi:hypothetical protein
LLDGNPFEISGFYNGKDLRIKHFDELNASSRGVSLGNFPNQQSIRIITSCIVLHPRLPLPYYSTAILLITFSITKKDIISCKG